MQTPTAQYQAYDSNMTLRDTVQPLPKRVGTGIKICMMSWIGAGGEHPYLKPCAHVGHECCTSDPEMMSLGKTMFAILVLWGPFEMKVDHAPS